MSVLYYYAKPSPRDHAGFASIDLFWAQLRHFFNERLRAQVFELQPGDGTRYRFAIAQENLDCVVVTMLVPSVYAIEVDPRLERPQPIDIQVDNPYTAAIFADVLSAVVWGDHDRYYDYVRHEPRWLSRTAPGMIEEKP